MLQFACKVSLPFVLFCFLQRINSGHPFTMLYFRNDARIQRKLLLKKLQFLPPVDYLQYYPVAHKKMNYISSWLL